MFYIQNKRGVFVTTIETTAIRIIPNALPDLPQTNFLPLLNMR